MCTSSFAEVYLKQPNLQTQHYNGVSYLQDPSNIALDSISSPPVSLLQVNRSVDAIIISFVASPNGDVSEGQQIQPAGRNIFSSCDKVYVSGFSAFKP